MSKIITSNIFRRRASVSRRTSIKSRSESLSWNTIHSPPPRGFDLRVIPVSLSSLSQHSTRQRKTSPESAFSPGFHPSQCLIPPNKQLSSPDGDILRHEEHIGSPPIQPTAMTSHSPVSSPSWDRSSVSSAESGFVPDVPTAEPIPEQIGFGGMYYGHSQPNHYQPRWEFKFPDPGPGHSASSRTMEHSPDVHAMSSPQLVGSRGEFSTRHLSRLGTDEISYTDEANSKISNRLRRRCFNCKAIETSTWRRSVLSPGKLLCNKCGLFERTHAIPRPKKFPRRRTHGSKVIRPPTTHPDMRTSFVNRHSKDTEPPSLPTTQLLHALDPISGEIYPQHTPWNSSASADATPARVGRCYATTEPASVYHQSGQFPPTALSGAIWI